MTAREDGSADGPTKPARADYRRIASTYDRARVLRETSLDLWLRLLGSGARLQPGSRVLDLGCGTGRFAVPFAHRLGCRVLGLDRSIEMLGKARAKDPEGPIAWACADAARLPLADGAFDVVFMSHLLNHVDDPAAVLREVWRVLAPGGTVLIRYGAMAQIRDDPEHTFFPEAVPIDEARTPEVESTEGWLRSVGFDAVRSQEVRQATYATAEERLAAVRLKSGSMLTLISDEAFQEGVARMAAYVAEHPADEWLLHDRMTLTEALRR